MCVPLSVLKRLWERGSSGKMVAVGRRCKQTVVKKATSYIIEGDVKASSLQGCQCQEAEPGWEQRAPPCLPLQRAAIYIVNTHTHTHILCLSLSQSVSHLVLLSLLFLFFFNSGTFSVLYMYALDSPSSVMLRTERSDTSWDKIEIIWRRRPNWYNKSEITVKRGKTKRYCGNVCALLCLWWVMVWGNQARSDWSL